MMISVSPATIIMCFSVAYLCGSIPFGLLIGKMVKGIDLRQYGSGNIGATNVFRVVGKRWGGVALLLDTAKGSCAILLSHLISAQPLSLPLDLLLGATAITAHSFSLWIQFKGGKGVATSLGVFLCIIPVPTVVSFLIFVVAFALTRIISISSLIAALVFPMNVFLFCRWMDGFVWLQSISLLLTLFIFYKHRTNIARLMRNEEKRLI